MENSFGTVLTCLVGLLIGGAIGGIGVTFLQQLRTGQVRLPPSIGLGPVRLDISGLMPPADGIVRPPADTSGFAPLLEGGSSLTGGCLAAISAGMVLVGFVLPWASCNLVILSGSFSGLSALVTLGVWTVVALLGAAGSGSRDLAALGGTVIALLLVVTIVIALTPIMGWRIGREGLELIQSLRTSNAYRRSAAQAITRSAVIGLAPLLCYFSISISNLNLSAVPGLGSSIGFQSADIGLWITMGGFGLAFVAGLIISTAAALAEQLPAAPARRISNYSPPVEVKPPADVKPLTPPNACPKCGTAFLPTDQFCTTCGLRLIS